MLRASVLDGLYLFCFHLFNIIGNRGNGRYAFVWALKPLA